MPCPKNLLLLVWRQLLLKAHLHAFPSVLPHLEACNCRRTGYGTFTIPAAKISSGMVHALDIDPEMAATTAQKAQSDGPDNVWTRVRDFVVDGTGLLKRNLLFPFIFSNLYFKHSIFPTMRPLKRTSFLLSVLCGTSKDTFPFSLFQKDTYNLSSCSTRTR